MTDTEARVIQYYNEHAQLEAERAGRFVFPKFLTDFIISALDRTSDPLLLDTGCGAGRLRRRLKELGISRYVGIDPSEKLIDIARQKYPNSDFRVARTQDIQTVLHEKCDVVIAVGWLHLVQKRHMQAVLSAIRMVSHEKTSACFYVAEGRGETLDSDGILNARWNKDEYTALLKRAGFKVLKRERWKSALNGNILFFAAIAKPQPSSQ